MRTALIAPCRVAAVTDSKEAAINLDDCGEKGMPLEVWTQSWTAEPQEEKILSNTEWPVSFVSVACK